MSKLEKEMEKVREQLNDLIRDDRSRLMSEEVYLLSVKLDDLIVRFMRTVS